ncbi:MAG TPA: type IV toxin-antitoxin system AbiEi family antitoxin domain-containing protein [Pseudobdellovibrionaceae bacterium]|nr:type IV toxin-antitoxin system AbiEi family antitoxin domain-containing protein [Pseudobdellovibrionaceae bacterium]
MGELISNNINQLLSEWPPGGVLTSQYLGHRGYSRQQLQNYLKAGWIERIGVGAYKKARDPVGWSGALFALQDQLDLPVYIGGKNALELLGKGQYLKLGQRNLAFYGPRKVQLPVWFQRYEWSTKISYQQSSLFEESRGKFGSKDVGYTSIEEGGYKVVISAAERAILEYLDGLPLNGSYQEAIELMENLTSLRPFIMQHLLEICRSLKVKRLFLHFADKVHHPWFKRLQIEKVSLGIGKRVVFKPGRLDRKYQITVPKESREK